MVVASKVDRAKHLETRVVRLNFESHRAPKRGNMVSKVESSLGIATKGVLVVNTEVSTSFNPDGPFSISAQYETIFFLSPEDHVTVDDISEEDIKSLSRFALREHSFVIALMTKLSSGMPFISSPRHGATEDDSQERVDPGQ